MPPVVSPEIAAVRSHYTGHLGAPHDVVELSGGLAPLSRLEIACFAPGGAGGPVVYATCGLSRVELEGGRRAEALAIIRPAPSKDARTALLKLMGKVGLHIATVAGPPVVPGTVLRGLAELGTISAMEAMLVLPAITFPESFQRFQRADGKQVQLWWLVPIFEAEAQIAEARGSTALLDQFAAARCDLSSWRRPALGGSPDPQPAAPAATPPAKPADKAARVADLKASALERAARAEARKAWIAPPKDED